MKARSWLFPALLLAASPAFAQCPDLPEDSGLAWEATQGPEFLYCRAMRGSDGTQAFSVMLKTKAPFRERYMLREERGVIDGHEVRWYRGDVAQNGVIVRETQIELDDDLYAHIMFRVDTEAQRAESQRLVGGLRFHDTRIGSN